MDDVGLFEFGDDDIVRNPLITKILKRYEEWGLESKWMEF
jgi:phosphate starvation-inducible protein PhoH